LQGHKSTDADPAITVFPLTGLPPVTISDADSTEITMKLASVQTADLCLSRHMAISDHQEPEAGRVPPFQAGNSL
jgi:hypothetical protein